MTTKNKANRFHRLSVWAMTICVTAVFAVFILNSTAGAASAQNATLPCNVLVSGVMLPVQPTETILTVLWRT